MKNIYKALAAFQQEVPSIHQGASGFNYTYADLHAIFGVINPLLKKYGLGFTQLVNRDCLETMVFHSESGEFITSETNLLTGVSLRNMNDFQVLGSQITYLRRYALSSLLGLVTDVDNDGAGDQNKKPEPKKLKILSVKAYKEVFDGDKAKIEKYLDKEGMKKAGFELDNKQIAELTARLAVLKSEAK